MTITTIYSNGVESDRKVITSSYLSDINNNRQIHISDDEKQLLEQIDDSFSKQLITDRISIEIIYDFEQYIKSDETKTSLAFEKEPVLSQGAWNQIEESNRALKDLFKEYDSCLKHKASFIIPNTIITRLNHCNWVNTLIFHVRNNRTNIRIRNNSDVSNKITYMISLINLIRKYYYVLIRAGESELRWQADILKPFIVTVRQSNYLQAINRLSLTDKSFLNKIALALYETKGQGRSDIYSLTYSLQQVIQYDQPTSYIFVLKLPKDPPGDHLQIEISAIEYCNLRYLPKNDELICFLKELFNIIYAGYKIDYQNLWNNEVISKMQTLGKGNISWSNFFFAFLDEYVREYKQKNYYQVQYCFYRLIIKLLDFSNPELPCINRELIIEVLTLLNNNKSPDQHGLYEIMHKLGYVMKQADLDNIKLITELHNWGDVEKFKKSVFIAEDIIKFLEPILNVNYINVDIISIDNFKRMIRNILLSPSFVGNITTCRNTAIEKKIKTKFNLPLLLNILGVFYGLTVGRDSHGKPEYLVRQYATDAFNQLVLKYGIKNDKNNNKYLTQYDYETSRYRVISRSMVESVYAEMKKKEYREGN